MSFNTFSISKQLVPKMLRPTKIHTAFAIVMLFIHLALSPICSFPIPEEANVSILWPLSEHIGIIQAEGHVNASFPLYLAIFTSPSGFSLSRFLFIFGLFKYFSFLLGVRKHEIEWDVKIATALFYVSKNKDRIISVVSVWGDLSKIPSLIKISGKGCYRCSKLDVVIIFWWCSIIYCVIKFVHIVQNETPANGKRMHSWWQTPNHLW